MSIVYYITFEKCVNIFFGVFLKMSIPFFGCTKNIYITEKKYVKMGEIKRWQLKSGKEPLNYYAYNIY